MSRSYKKTPYCGDTKGKENKRLANHKVRQYLKNNEDVVLRGGAYKRLYDTWDICDYYWIANWEEYWLNCIESYNNWGYRYKKEKPNYEKEFRRWWKYYKMK